MNQLLQFYLPETGEIFTDFNAARKREAEILAEIQRYREIGVWDLIQSDDPVWGRRGSAYPAYMIEGNLPGQTVRSQRRQRLERAREYVCRQQAFARSKVS